MPTADKPFLQPSLTVYRASAGSGKTHTLTGEYLRLALSEKTSFRQIQAITFTNKATAEMKERILSELHILQTFPEKSPFRETLLPLFGSDMAQLKKRAGAVLAEILSDYTHLRIKTIDSFFQEVIRNFARELNIQGSFRVELNQERVLERAAVQLITHLDVDTNKDLVSWLKKLGRDMIARGRGHNVIAEVKRLGRELFKEGFIIGPDKKENTLGRLPDRNEIETFRLQMKNIVDSFEGGVKAYAEDLRELFDRAPFSPTDFKYGMTSGPASLYNAIVLRKEIKEPTGRMRSFAEGEVFTEGKSNGLSESDPLILKLVSLVKDYNEFLDADHAAYLSAKAVLENLFRLGILQDLQQSIEELSKQDNSMLISDSSSLISRIIAGCDTPFIYERIGGTIKHHMIDEFQDTSRKQYENLKPLLDEGAAHGWFNLIVGDVKQSIYRFRNADRSILSDQLPRDFRSNFLLRNLQENWRSLPEIVRFNNTLYDKAPQVVTEHMRLVLGSSSHISPSELETMLSNIQAGYLNQRQTAARQSDEKGAVVLHRYESDDTIFEEKIEGSSFRDPSGSATVSQHERERDPVLCSLPYTLIDIQRRGVEASNIAILVRNKKEATRIASYLLMWQNEHPLYNQSQPNITLNVLSSEALLVKSSPTVRFVVDTLAFLSKPSVSTLRQNAYQSYIRLGQSDELRDISHGELLQADFTPQEIRQLLQIARTDLFNMVEMILSMVKDRTSPSEAPYIIAFLDLVSDYLLYELPDIASFLDWWETKSQSSCIESPANAHAITILTIHKSKGLGFPVVLLPYPTWDIDINYAQSRSEILWCRTGEIEDRRFHALTQVPLSISSTLCKTFFAPHDARERISCAIDNLNLLYVLTTRAKDELHIWLQDENPPTGKNKKPSLNVAQLIHLSLSDLPQEQDELYISHRLADEPISSLPIRNKSRRQNGAIQIVLEDLGLPEEVDPTQIGRKLRIKRNAADFVKFRPNRMDAIIRGRVLHRVMELIDTSEDLPEAIHQLLTEGCIVAEEADEIERLIRQSMAHPLAKQWFDGLSTVLKETSIVVDERGLQYRPDRVMIHPDGQSATIVDYKFGQKRNYYHKQLNRYRSLVQQMGYSPIDAYLFYIDSNEIVQVDEDSIVEISE